MMQNLIAIVAALWIAGCATFIAETPQQKLYGATIDLQTAFAASADYCSLPWASLDRCESLFALRNQAQILIDTVELGLVDGTITGAQASDILRIIAAILERLEAEIPAPSPVVPSPSEVLP